MAASCSEVSFQQEDLESFLTSPGTETEPNTRRTCSSQSEICISSTSGVSDFIHKGLVCVQVYGPVTQEALLTPPVYSAWLSVDSGESDAWLE